MAEHGKVGRNHMIAGTGNTQAMYQQLRMGWQASWMPTDNHFCKVISYSDIATHRFPSILPSFFLFGSWCLWFVSMS